MPSVVLLGTGNVAQHLFHAFKKAEEVELIQIYGRKMPSLKAFSKHVEVTNNLSKLKDADIYILAISDSAITPVSELLNEKNGLIVHTSGAVSLRAISHKRQGVFYPLQTFTQGKSIDFSTIPICIEATKVSDLEQLKHLGMAVSKSVHEITSSQRKKIHLSAVFVNNFTNHLFHIGEEICKENKIPFQLLHPLISETVDKIRNLSPLHAQTGPARRNDIETMQLHLDELKNPLQKKLYQILSESIKTSYEKEL